MNLLNAATVCPIIAVDTRPRQLDPYEVIDETPPFCRHPHRRALHLRARVGSKRASGFKDFDLAASKRIAIAEGSNIEFRVSPCYACNISR